MLLAAGGCQRNPEPEGRGVAQVDSTSIPAAEEFGTYHALLIGIDDYQRWPSLRFAEADAADIGDLLEAQYGFSEPNVTRVLGADATRSRILGALREQLENLETNDNLLVYYAGHGQLDPLTESGYWIPVDGDLYDDSSWVPFTTITALLRGRNVHAKNVVVITDSCYGGALSRAGPTPGNPRPGGDMGRYVAQLAQLAGRPSRQIIASGGYEQVPDESAFAALLKKALAENQYPAVDIELLFFTQVYPELRTGGQQEAIMSRVVSGPEADGQFVLVRDAGSGVSSAPPARLTVQSDSNAGRVLIDGEDRGQPPVTAELPQGSHVVRVERDGFVAYEEELSLGAGEARVVQARLEAERASPPEVVFEISPGEVRAGGRYTLTWRTENAIGVEISPLGEVPLSGSRELTADASLTYELSAVGADGQRSVMRKDVSVKPALPSIDYFVAKPEGIQAGQATTLAWRTNDAGIVSIEGFGSVPAAGMQEFRPAQTTKYVLTATNELKETVQREVTVNVTVEPAPEITSFTVTPTQVTAGAEVELRWVATGRSARLSDVGPVPLAGSRRVKPTASTAYTLSVQNASGAVVEGTAAVRVVPTAPSGAARCIQGFVWREAYEGDRVCVTPETRARALADNAAAATRVSRTDRSFGSETCLQGFVWREANPTDHVCVTPETRDQTRRDNEAAASRRIGSVLQRTQVPIAPAISVQ